MMIYSALDTASPSFTTFQLPRVSSLIMYESWIIVAFVEVFEDRGEDFGFFVGEGDSFVVCFHELPAAGCLEEG